MHRLDVKAPGIETALAASGVPAPNGHRLGRNDSKLTPQSDPRQINPCGKHEAKGRIAPEVRRSALGSLADIGQPIRDVRFASESRHVHRRNRCLLNSTKQREN
jgi:hypothetical protein